MDKWQAQDAFWNSFSIPAYDEQTAYTQGEQPAYPHITYEAAAGVMGQYIPITASLWYRSASWRDISRKSDEILQAIYRGQVIAIEGGYLWLKCPETTPFAQRVASGDDSIRRILLTIEAECLTAK